MRTDLNIADPDGFYAAWIAAQEHMSEVESADYNARLVLLLANQIGDITLLTDCITAAQPT